MIQRASVSIHRLFSSRPVRFTSLIGLVSTSIALIILAQNAYKYAEVEEFSVRLSLIYNLIVYSSFALFTPLVLKASDRIAGNVNTPVLKIGAHVLVSLLLALTHMLFCNLVLFAIGLSSTPIFPRFIAKYLTNVIHIHLLIYWAIVLLAAFYKDLFEKPGETEVEEPDSKMERFMIRQNGRSFYVEFDQVLWIEAHDHYQKLHTVDGCHLIKDSMKNLEETLPKDLFKRAHRSYFVNVQQIVAYLNNPGEQRGRFVQLSNDTTLKIGQAYSRRFAE